MDKVKENLPRLEAVFEKYAVKFAYLFGSRATGHVNRESDYDFAVMLPDDLDAKNRFEIRLKLMSEIMKILKTDAVDLNVLNDTHSIFFKFVIIKEGLLIHNADPGARLDFELKTMNDYYDYKPFLKAYNKAYIERRLKE